MFYTHSYESPLGPLLLSCTDTALTGVQMGLPSPAEQDHPLLKAASTWLDAYFAGTPLPLTIALEPAGTPFQKLIWQQLLDIPFGQTRTYGDLAADAARLMGKQRMSAQAVGGAVGRNPIAIAIPCHRCIGAGGNLVGYAGGLEKKRWLLQHEAQFSTDSRSDFVHFAKT